MGMITSLQFSVPYFVITEPLVSIDVENWCKENSITYTFMGRYRNSEVWYVEDEDQRTLFALRWKENG